MERIVYRMSLDTTRSGVQKILQGFKVGDSLARRIEIALTSRAEEYIIPSGVVATMYVNNTSVNACVIEDNKVIYDVRDTDISASGMVTMQLKLADNSMVLCAPTFKLEVTETSDSSSATTTPTYTALTEALVQAQTAYNKRLTSIEIDEDTYMFYAYYADGTHYESDAFANIGDIVAELDDAIIAESERETAEQLRVSAESARVTAENNRSVAELSRSTNETSRETAEDARVEAETGRASAESARTTAEATRVSNESSRVNAEASRVTAETQRATDTATAIANVNTALSGIDAKLDDVDEAISDAEEATAHTEEVASETDALRESIQRLIDEGGVVTPLEKEHWNDAYSKEHVHSNKTTLDSLTDSVITNSHTHSNKTLLDSIASDNVHTHSNKSVIDGIASSDVTNWNGKADVPTVTTSTLYASQWTGTEAPYSNVVSVTGVTNNSIVTMFVPSNVTSAVAEAYAEAMCVNGTVSNGTITVNAFKAKPTVDLPIAFKIEKG